MEYLQITVSTTSEASELVAMVLYEQGSEGVSIRDDADIRELIEKKLNWDYVDEGLVNSLGKKALVSGFFDVDFDINAVYNGLEELKENAVFALGSLEVSVSRIDSADWENEWRKYYAPILLDRVVIVPAWQKWTDENFIPVYIEPGMAFGTGNHETTSMCIRLMQKMGLSGQKVLDMGCGSGILGVTAVKLGAKSVVLSDIDPLALEASEYNARLNGVENSCTITGGDLNVGEDVFDAVIANITADVLMRLNELLVSRLKTDGYAVISGIINARAEEVEKCYCKNFDLVEKIQNGEWQAMLLKKKV